MSEATAFVGTADNINQATLENLIQTCMGNQAWRFLRWPHEVKLLEPTKAIDYSCREGQVFDQKSELRWKKLKGEQYSVLVLSTIQLDKSLTPVGTAWMPKDLEANFYPKTETRFPKGLDYNDSSDNKLDIGQRYFIDEATGTVHFIALRVK
ncbi:hypothetical protein IQ260_12755 [Leptolyngbya cf. ectocarpi LEGE 11479]|uniref:Uncharacterized protein n=1 Tax=Leptolyngbya cf. ectocarpi LEGE 11479 TaxID=1828722 RepID=A0A928ZU76_LEPEC|nr:hypothetical protein [Leptolyngbya ectocarpi]MBE9067529.1 hypothetical protein [Leptolyngbya cf. ectocarpi LEGE 11479]